MRQVSNAFLLNMAEVSATLIGLFLVGVFFYVESSFRRFDRARERFEPYLRSGTRITMIVFAISLGLSLALVALTLPWARALFAVLSLVLVVANVDSALRVRGVKKATGSTGLLVSEAPGDGDGGGAHGHAVGPRRAASDQGGPHVGDRALVRRGVPQHQCDGDVGLRHRQSRGHRAKRGRRTGLRAMDVSSW
jgi:hypothetical protein